MRSTGAGSISARASACLSRAASSTRNSISRCRSRSMAIADSYRKQVSLLIRTIPLVAAEKEFALKGGTAINLFLRDMPRLSVDIDLTYIPVADRATSLKGIDFGMKRIADGLTKGVPNVELSTSVLRGESCTTKLLMRADDAQIKIEVTPVLRGCVYEPAMKN